jgi:hypothetical protein
MRGPTLILCAVAFLTGSCRRQPQPVQAPNVAPTESRVQAAEKADTVNGNVPWADAVQMIQDGKVSSVVQYHSLDVILTTIEGTQLKTKEPKIDAAKRLVETVDPTGKRIVYGTE